MSTMDLSVVLRLVDQLSAPAKKASDALRGITKAAADLKKIGGGLDTLPKQIKESSAAIRALQADVRSFSSAFRGAADSARSMSKEMAANRGKSWMAEEVKNLRAMVDLQGKLASGPRRFSGVHGSLLGVSLFGGHPHLRSEGREGWDEASAVRHQMAIMQTLGMSQVEMAEAYKKAVHVSSDITTSTVSQNLQTIREMRGAFLHPHDAVTNLGALVKADAIFNAISESKPGMHGLRWKEQAYDFAKAIEMLGVTDPKQFEDYLGGMMQAMGAFGGKVQGRDFHGTIKYARTAAQNWSKDFVTQVLPTLIQEYKVGGGSGASGSAGQGLMSLFEVVSTGTMKEEAAKRWVGLGLAKAGDITKSGLRPGAIAGNHLFQADPYQWAWQVLVPAMVRKGIITSNEVDAIKRGDTKDKEFAKNITKYIAGLGGTRTARDALTKLILQAARIERDRQNVLETMDFKAWDTLSKGSPTVALQAFGTQLKGFIAALIDPLMPVATKVLAGLGAALSSMMKAMRLNPEIAYSLTGLLAAGGALLLPSLLRSTLLRSLIGGGVGFAAGGPMGALLGAVLLKPLFSGIVGGAESAIAGGAPSIGARIGSLLATGLIAGIMRVFSVAGLLYTIDQLIYANLSPETKKALKAKEDAINSVKPDEKTSKAEILRRAFDRERAMLGLPLVGRSSPLTATPLASTVGELRKSLGFDLSDADAQGKSWAERALDMIRSTLGGASVNGPQINAPAHAGGIGHASLQIHGGVQIAVHGTSDPHATADAVYRRFNTAVHRQLSDGAFG